MRQGARIPIVLSAVLLIQLTIVSTAFGDNCYSECVNRYNCYSSHPFGGSSCYDLCRESCRPDGWGAIAYSWKDKIYGWSYALGDKHTAEQVAMQSCANAHGAGCILQASYFEACASVAADRDLVAWGTSDTKVKAQQRALKECSKIGGKNCLVEASVCSARNPNSDSAPSATPRSAPAPKATAWGAIAYSSRDMGAGWSQGKDDRASAEREAMNICAQRGKSCAVQTAFNKACGALAADRAFTGFGTSADQSEAQQKAIAECKRAGGTACALHISFCSF
jgi:hypothetical protein